MKLMGTGSRSLVLHPDRKEIFALLEFKILLMFESNPDLVLITGMAEGFDEAIAKIGLKNNIPYLAYIPNYGYADYYWKNHSKMGKNRINTYQKLLNGAADITFVCQSNLYVDGVHSNFVRNSAMIEACDSAIAWYERSDAGGTADALRKLRAAGKPVSIYPWEDKLF